MARLKATDNEQIAIYSRKSKFTGKGESIENQIAWCKQYICTHYPHCKDEEIVIYEDEGFSGGNTARPQFKKMMADAKTKKFLAIVCYRLDRISRNIGDFAKLIEELDKMQVAFVSIKEQFDTTSPMGRAMMYISSVFSQLERETIAERIRDNMYALSKTGRWLGGVSPTGYTSESVTHVTVDGKTKKACKLKIVPQEAETVRQIYKIFLETNALTKTETYLLQQGYRTKNNLYFKRFTLRNILTNPVYMIADSDAYHYLKENGAALFAEKQHFDGEHGVMAYNRTLQKPGKAHQIRPINEWIVAVGKHTGLISGADWVRTQACLAQNRSKAFRKPRSHTALLSGLLYCAHCGDYMRPKLGQRMNAQGAQMYTYLCTIKEKSRSQCCRMQNANGNRTDQAVCEVINGLSEDRATFIRQLAIGKKQLESDDAAHSEGTVHLHTALAENEKEIAALASSLTKVSGTTAEAYIVKQIEERHEKSEMLKRRIAEAENSEVNQTLSEATFGIIRQLSASFKTLLDTMPIEQKRATLRACVKKVVWDGTHIHLYLFGAQDNTGLPSGEAEKPLGMYS